MSILRTKLPKKTKNIVQTIFVFLLIVIIFSFSSRLNPFSNTLSGLQFGFTGASTGVKAAYDYIFKSRAELQEKLDYYQNLVGSLAQDEARTQELEQNLKELQTLIEYQDSLEYTSTAARVISRSVDNNHAILINKGETSGVREGLAVVIENGHLIGTISEVYKNSALVLLIPDEASKIPGAILGSTKTIGLVEGQNGYLLAMNYIPQNENIFVSDVVITSGLDGSVPRGLVIGIVNLIVIDETAPFQQALIEPIFDSSDYINILILDPFSK